MEERTRELTEQVHASGDLALRHRAAELRAHVPVDEDDEEAWLRKADQGRPSVRRNLDEVQARRLLREGKRREADAIYAKIAAEWDQEVGRDAAAPNNAAVALQARYMCTGNPQHLAAALSRLERARALVPDSSVVVGNLAGVAAHLAYVRVLATWFDLAVLTPDDSKALGLVQLLAAGPERAALARALRAEPALRRALELTRQVQVLAPQRAGSYTDELAIDALLDDRVGLERLRERLLRIEVAPDEGLQRWLAGDNDEVVLESLQDSAAWDDRVIADARRRGHPRTLAAALALRAETAGRISVLGEHLPSIERQVELLREAVALAPLEGMRARLGSALVVLAFARVAAASKALTDSWRRDRRQLGVLMMVDALLAGGDAGALAALRQRPELTEAAPMLAAELAQAPDVKHWVFARLVGDADLEKRAADALAAPSKQLHAEIAALLARDYPDAQKRLARMRSLRR
jgi:hypothetical protein